jgi:hypothetical protein
VSISEDVHQSGQDLAGAEDARIGSLGGNIGVVARREPRLSDIRNRFGDRVADIVRSCSDSVVNTSVRLRKPRRTKHPK